MEQKSRVGAREKTRKEGLMGLGIEVLTIQEEKKKKKSSRWEEKSSSCGGNKVLRR